MYGAIQRRLASPQPPTTTTNKNKVFHKMGHLRPLFGYLRSFSNKYHSKLTTNQCEKNSIQYTALGFEPMTFRT